jgi:hypothetical protein
MCYAQEVRTVKAKEAAPTEKKAAAPAPQPKQPNPIAVFLAGPGRWAVGCVVLIAAVGFGWNALWQQVGPHVATDPQYLLTAENLRVTPLPEWIRSDIKSEVISSASLDTSLSLLDDEITVQLAHAFALHPWVAKVVRVGKGTGGVDVELEYRRPVAMVEVPGGVFPIDRQAILLPNDDFTAADVKNYPRISDVSSEPTAPVGTIWRDARLAGAASLAALLADHWQSLKLQRISVILPSSIGGINRQPGYTVYTQEGTLIRWGRAPSEKPAAEMSSEDKLTTLLQYVQEHGTLEGKEGRQVLDLQSGPTLRVVQNTIQPLPKAAGSE